MTSSTVSELSAPRSSSRAGGLGHFRFLDAGCSITIFFAFRDIAR